MPARYTVFAYPSESNRQYAWVPDVDPVPEGSGDPTSRGVYSDLMGDGTIWSNRLRPEKLSRRWRFNGLSTANRFLFAQFLASVGGLPFRLADPVTMTMTVPGYVTAQLFGAGLAPNWERQRGGLWGVVVEVRL